jgi:hypothetical protein
MISMVLAFGAPVMDAAGNRALNVSVNDALVSAVTVEVSCSTVG